MGVYNFSAAKISHRSIEVDRCHLLILSHCFHGQASDRKAGGQELIEPPCFSGEGHSTLRSSLAANLDHMKGAMPLVVMHLSYFSTFIFINDSDLRVDQHVGGGIDGDH